MPIYNPKCPSQFRKWLCPSCSLKGVAMHCCIYDFDLLPYALASRRKHVMDIPLWSVAVFTLMIVENQQATGLKVGKCSSLS